jgi:hypothetical protein
MEPRAALLITEIEESVHIDLVERGLVWDVEVCGNISEVVIDVVPL